MKVPLRERIAAVAGPGLVAIAAVALGVRTWKAWGDPVVDFGREVYVAWRLSEGAALYRDVAHFNGPLSAHVNAAWFDLTGPGLAQLAVLNLLVLAAVTAALFMLCRSVGDRFAATVAAIVFLALQGFGYFGSGTFNFVTPYSHEVTHGLLLGLLAVVAVGAFARTGRPGWALGAGACAGLSFLTKPETFLAALFAVGIGLGAATWHRTAKAAARDARRPGGVKHALAAACAGAGIPPLVAFAALATTLGTAGAADGLLRQWRMATDPRITALPYYQWVSGLDAPGSNLVALAVWTLGGAVTLLVLARASEWIGSKRSAGALAFAAAALTVLAASPWASWHRIWFVLPAGVAAILVDAGLRVANRKGDAAREVTMLAFGTLALTLLAKQALHPRGSHYGFALAAPAVAVCVVALVARLPGRLPAGAGVFRHAAVGLITGVTLFHLGLSHAALATATASAERVGAGSEVLWTDALRARVLGEVIERLQEAPAEATVAVLPEGAFLNFVVRRPNPTPFVQLMPPEMITWGEDEVLEAYRRSPPDLVVLLHRDRSEYGTGPFGTAHARHLMDWLRDGYRSVYLAGTSPFGEAAGFGAEILERKTPGTRDILASQR